MYVYVYIYILHCLLISLLSYLYVHTSTAAVRVRWGGPAETTASAQMHTRHSYEDFIRLAENRLAQIA